MVSVSVPQNLLYAAWFSQWKEVQYKLICSDLDRFLFHRMHNIMNVMLSFSLVLKIHKYLSETGF